MIAVDQAQSSLGAGRVLLTVEARDFLFRLLVWFPALLLVWMPLGSAYRATLVATGNAVFGLVGGEHEVLFLPHGRWAEIGVTETADVAVLVRMANWRIEQGRRQHVLARAICTFYQPFAATMFLLALFLAVRMSRQERWWKMAVAFAGLHVAMVAAVVIDVSHAFDSVRPAEAGAWSRTVVAMLHYSATDWPAGVFIVPLLIWVFVVRPWRETK